MLIWRLIADPDAVVLWGRALWRWSLFVAAFSLLIPVCHIIATFVIRILLVISGEAHLFYFLAAMEYPLATLFVAVGCKISWIFLLLDCTAPSCYGLATQAPDFDYTLSINSTFDFVSDLVRVKISRVGPNADSRAGAHHESDILRPDNR